MEYTKKEGIILEGGATRGVFTAGVLDYLMEENFYFSYVSGVSAGACNAIDYVSRQIGRTRDCMIHENKEDGYFQVREVIRQRSLFDMDKLFDEYPNRMYPFDYETFFQSPMTCEIVVTNSSTGEAEYFKDIETKEELMQICRASSSMPLVTPMVEFHGEKYVDGGIADSIPVIHAMKSGYRKNVVVLTRQKGYRKKNSRKSIAFYQAGLRKYPNLAAAMIRRAEVYNRTLELVEKWEEEGNIFVIRPQIKPVSRTETRTEVLSEFYQHGYDQMKDQMEAMIAFLEQ